MLKKRIEFVLVYVLLIICMEKTDYMLNISRNEWFMRKMLVGKAAQIRARQTIENIGRKYNVNSGAPETNFQIEWNSSFEIEGNVERINNCP